MSSDIVRRMKTMVLGDALEIENLSELSNVELAKDMGILKTYQKATQDVAFIYSMSPSDPPIDMMDKSMVSILKAAGDFNPYHFQPPLNPLSIPGIVSRIDDFLCLIAMSEEETSSILRDALMHEEITLGNIQSQWRDEIRDRARMGSLV